MEQLKNFADSRLVFGCVYCGGPEETREHVPSRVFLDLPYPANLPLVGSCRSCNNGFSKDEEYVACLIEAAIAGSTDPAAIRRQRIADKLRKSLALAARIKAGQSSTTNGVTFQIEPDRVRRVVLKLARGHAVYELAQECRGEPASVWWLPIFLLDDEQRREFESPEMVELFGEVGSRSMQRFQVVEVLLVSEQGAPLKQHVIVNDWIEVQSGRYRYHALDNGGIVRIRLVIGDYLAVEVIWHLDSLVTSNLVT